MAFDSECRVAAHCASQPYNFQSHLVVSDDYQSKRVAGKPVRILKPPNRLLRDIVPERYVFVGRVITSHGRSFPPDQRRENLEIINSQIAPTGNQIRDLQLKTSALTSAPEKSESQYGLP
ncbi:jg15978 [Pararge aegeria aegeria]|uniref:Jg15978 protein n=1 Tax=Pararge aegeria aegeria TaxID=348720 RepID=A0A8S4SQA9_9NEOP|nr:jg15978 [Pararge aegeria aegeria]